MLNYTTVVVVYVLQTQSCCYTHNWMATAWL